jgi:hypothetical protein
MLGRLFKKKSFILCVMYISLQINEFNIFEDTYKGIGVKFIVCMLDVYCDILANLD